METPMVGQSWQDKATGAIGKLTAVYPQMPWQPWTLVTLKFPKKEETMAVQILEREYILFLNVAPAYDD